MQQNRSNTNSVEKALFILKAFSTDRPIWGVRELSAFLNFSPPTVQRLLQTLKEHSFVEQDPATRQYRLGNIYFQMVHILQNTFPIARVAQPFMHQLLLRTNETVHLNVIDSMERLCIDNIESSQSLKASMPVGSRSPLFAGASSKCLLAYSEPEFIDRFLEDRILDSITPNTITDKKRLKSELAAIVEKGYAESMGERNQGLGSLSAPVAGQRNEILASISLAIPEIRFRDTKHREFCTEELLKTGRELSKAMGKIG